MFSPQISRSKDMLKYAISHPQCVGTLPQFSTKISQFLFIIIFQIFSHINVKIRIHIKTTHNYEEEIMLNHCKIWIWNLCSLCVCIIRLCNVFVCLCVSVQSEKEKELLCVLCPLLWSLNSNYFIRVIIHSIAEMYIYRLYWGLFVWLHVFMWVILIHNRERLMWVYRERTYPPLQNTKDIEIAFELWGANHASLDYCNIKVVIFRSHLGFERVYNRVSNLLCKPVCTAFCYTYYTNWRE